MFNFKGLLPQMSIELSLFFLIQGGNTLLAIVLNLFLVYLAIFQTRSNIGSYQMIVIVYALFEALYAIVTFIGMPVSQSFMKPFIVRFTLFRRGLGLFSTILVFWLELAFLSSVHLCFAFSTKFGLFSSFHTLSADTFAYAGMIYF